MYTDTITFNIMIKSLIDDASFAFPRNYHQIPNLPTPAEPLPPQTHAAVGEHKSVNTTEVLKKKDIEFMDSKAKYIKGLQRHFRTTPTAHAALEIGYFPHMHPGVVGAVRMLDYMWYLHENPESMLSYLHEREKKVRQDKTVEMQKDNALLLKYIEENEKKLKHIIEKSNVGANRKINAQKDLNDLYRLRDLQFQDEDYDEEGQLRTDEDIGVSNYKQKNHKVDEEESIYVKRAKLLMKAKVKEDLKSRFPNVFDILKDNDEESPADRWKDYVKEEEYEKYGITADDFLKDPDHVNFVPLDDEDMLISDMIFSAVGTMRTKPNIASVSSIARLAADAGDMVLAHGLIMRMYQWNILFETQLRIMELEKMSNVDMIHGTPELQSSSDMTAGEAEDECNKLKDQMEKLKIYIMTALSGQKPLSLTQVSIFDAYWTRLCRVRQADSHAFQDMQMGQLAEFMRNNGSPEVADAILGSNGVEKSIHAPNWPAWLWPNNEHYDALSKLSVFESVNFNLPAPPMPVTTPGKLPYPMITPQSISIEQLTTVLKTTNFAQAFENAFNTESILQQHLKHLKNSYDALWLQEEEMKREEEDESREIEKQLENSHDIDEVVDGVSTVPVPKGGGRDRYYTEQAKRRYQHIERLLQCAQGWMNALQARVLITTVRAKQHYTVGVLSNVDTMLHDGDDNRTPISIPELPTMNDAVTTECIEELIKISKALTYHSNGLTNTHVKKCPTPYVTLVNEIRPQILNIQKQLSKWGIASVMPLTCTSDYDSVVPPVPQATPLSKHEQIDNLLACVPRSELISPLPDINRKLFLDIGSGDGEHALQHAKKHPDDIVLTCDILMHRLANMLHQGRVGNIPAMHGVVEQTNMDDIIDMDMVADRVEMYARDQGMSIDDVLKTLIIESLKSGINKDTAMNGDNIIDTVPKSYAPDSVNRVLDGLFPDGYLVNSMDYNMDNLYSYVGGVLDLMGALPEQSVDTIHIMHPPPPTNASYGIIPSPPPGVKLCHDDLSVTLNARSTLLTEQLMWTCARAMKFNTSIFILSDDIRVGQWLNRIIPYGMTEPEPIKHSRRSKKREREKKEKLVNEGILPSHMQLPKNVPKLDDYFTVEELDISTTALGGVKSRYQRMAAAGQLQSKYSSKETPAHAWRLRRNTKKWE